MKTKKQTTTKDTKATTAVKAAVIAGKARWLQDGFLVVGHIACHGCATYSHNSKDENIKDDELDASWATKKHIRSVSEHYGCGIAKNTLLRGIKQLGMMLPGGNNVLVPARRADELEKALRAVDTGIAAYNAEAKHTRLDGGYSALAVPGNDARMARALYGEVTDTLGRVADAIDAGDVAALRKAVADVARAEAVLPADTGKLVNALVAKARAEATAAVATAKKNNVKVEPLLKKISTAKDAGALRAGLVEVMKDADTAAAKVKYVPTTSVRHVE